MNFDKVILAAKKAAPIVATAVLTAIAVVALQGSLGAVPTINVMLVGKDGPVDVGKLVK